MDRKISVIIPFYNGVDWLCEAVQSIINQDYGHFEIIVVNDGSKEDIAPFLEKYESEVIYKYKENGGAASARNLALEMATGEFIAFLDADDIWLPQKTRLQINFMDEINAMWCHTGYYNWFPEIKKTILKNNSRDFGNVYKRSFISLKAPTPSIVIRKECFVENSDFKFFLDMKFAQDSALWSKIAFKYPLALVDEPLVLIRQRGTNADLSSIIRFKAKAKILEKIQEGHYKDVGNVIMFILYFYKYGLKFIYFLDKNLSFEKKNIELIGKFLWVIPFIIERIYVLYLVKNNTKYFYKK